MTQSVLNKDFDRKTVEIHIKKLDQDSIKELNKQKEQHKLYKNLNPRYFEEGIPLKEALEMKYLSDHTFSSRFNIFQGR
ncbi:MAG: hypothetical protein ACXABO_16955 [Promethearchaeota archaeon]|jgi:hypothetical protein